MGIIGAVGDEVIHKRLDLGPVGIGFIDILFNRADIKQSAGKFREHGGHSAQPAFGAGQEAFHGGVVVAVQHGQLIAAVVAQFVDAVGIAMSSLDSVNEAFVYHSLYFQRGHFISAETGIVVQNDIDVDCVAQGAKMIYHGTLVRLQVIRHDNQHTVGAAGLGMLAQLNGLCCGVPSGAGIHGYFPAYKFNHAFDKIFLFLIAHGNVFAGGAYAGNAVGPFFDNPLDIFFGFFLVVRFVGIPKRHYRGHYTFAFHFQILLMFIFILFQTPAV